MNAWTCTMLFQINCLEHMYCRLKIYMHSKYGSHEYFTTWMIMLCRVIQLIQKTKMVLIRSSGNAKTRNHFHCTPQNSVKMLKERVISLSLFHAHSTFANIKICKRAMTITHLVPFTIPNFGKLIAPMWPTTALVF